MKNKKSIIMYSILFNITTKVTIKNVEFVMRIYDIIKWILPNIP